MNMSARLEQFLRFYNQLSINNLQSLSQLYHPEVSFVDPVKQIKGLPALSEYFQHAYQNINSCQFDGHISADQGGCSFVNWTMTFSHSAIGNGKQIKVEGCSALQWQDGLIIYHRDYYDLHDMVFQHLPVIGWLTKKVKQRMADTSA